MFLRSLTTSIWLRKNCNDIFTYQEPELAARYLHPDTYFQAVQLSCKCNYSEFGHITVSKLIYVQN